MKAIVFSFLLLSSNCFCQSISFSTFREIYDYAPGDTFEIQCHEHILLGSTNDIDHTYLHVILSRQDVGDSVIYKVRTAGTYHWTDGTHHTYSSGADTISLVYSALDSMIFWDHTHLNPGCDTITTFCLFDSVYLDSTITDGKINHHKIGDWGGGADTIYIDGLGKFGWGNGSEDPGVTQGGCSMRYYHKANGRKWGFPYYFIIADINDLSTNTLELVVFPNPAFNFLTLKLSDFPNSDLYFQLFDVTGRQILHTNISSILTTFDCSNIATGIYYWQLRAEKNIMDTGKIVFE